MPLRRRRGGSCGGLALCGGRRERRPTLDSRTRGRAGRTRIYKGRNLIIDHRFTDFRPDQLLSLATELASLNVDVLVTGVNRNAVALQQATDRIPIVMAVAEDPVSAGLVKTLARPGGNVTGVTVPGPEIFGKNLELLHEALPKGARIAVLFNVISPINARYLKATEESARKLRIRLLQTGVRSVDDFAGAFAAMKQEQAAGLLVLGEPLLNGHRQQINDLAAGKGLATMWPSRDGVDTGGLMSYGANLVDLYRRAAIHVDKVLKGAKPGDLPMEQPTRFELVINLKTAKALGLTIPPSLLARADQVIE
jgi:ABC-type uncharacterized transport system substrate-binding protein